ncbi:hypothetical protein [Pseudonocardia sp. TRM90224]|uniref:hypothetical protein n=1 Tax=Pseudonocardia sp. TRM90224 TaxID=2812678 RepID=UPI001E3A38EE|nr:hypothetical protein [Pseudonocardia sp. TRM90224]
MHTTHNVTTPTTDAAGLLVPMTRGRERNTAYVVTATAPADPAQGSEHRHQVRRDPVAVLAGVLATQDPITNRSATALAAESATEMRSVRTTAELLAEGAQQAATERTMTWLDRLTDTGDLTPRTTRPDRRRGRRQHPHPCAAPRRAR